MPLQERLHPTRNFLKKENTTWYYYKSSLFKICTAQSILYLLHNDSLLMGSPISPLLANIFMDNKEHKIFNSKESNHIAFW